MHGCAACPYNSSQRCCCRAGPLGEEAQPQERAASEAGNASDSDAGAAPQQRWASRSCINLRLGGAAKPSGSSTGGRQSSTALAVNYGHRLPCLHVPSTSMRVVSLLSKGAARQLQGSDLLQ
jgi:hypothetical protein